MAKKYIQEDQKMRDQWKEIEKQRLEEENREIQRFADLQKQREAERKEVKKEQEAFKSKVQEEVSSKFICILCICFMWIVRLLI